MIIVLALFGVLLAPQDALCQRKRDRSKDKENDSLKQIVVDYTLSDSDKERVQSGIKLANYYLNENDVQCVEQANATIKIATKSKMNTEVGELYGIIGSYYYNNKNYKKAATAWESGYSILKKNNLAIPRAQICYQLGQCHQKLKNNRKARNYYDEAMTLAKKLGDRELMHTLTRSLCDIMLSDKNYKMAYEYLNAYFQEEKNKLGNQNAKLRDLNEEQEQIIEQKDSTIQEVVNQNYQLEMQRQQLKYDSAQLANVKRLQEDSLKLQMSENAKLQQENEFNRKIKIGFGIVLLLIGGVIYLILRNNRQKKRANTILQEKNHMISSQNEEIQRQNEEISKNLEEIAVKNKDITDSLTYAGTIQRAMLRDFEKHRSLMSDYFIFYAPKDIVSGDFYWAYKVGSKFVFTVGDCTGHSVPGAFMSMLGIALLNQIVA
jgi:tetratricopeptide (TPR) repeat protein